MLPWDSQMHVSHSQSILLCQLPFPGQISQWFCYCSIISKKSSVIYCGSYILLCSWAFHFLDCQNFAMSQVPANILLQGKVYRWNLSRITDLIYHLIHLSHWICIEFPYCVKLAIIHTNLTALIFFLNDDNWWWPLTAGLFLVHPSASGLILQIPPSSLVVVFDMVIVILVCFHQWWFCAVQ